MWTLWPARNNSEDHEKGDDPRGRSPQELHDLTTHGTIVGGEVVYEATQCYRLGEDYRASPDEVRAGVPGRLNAMYSPE